MRNLFERVRAHVGRPIAGKVTDALREALGNESDPWFQWLDRQRNVVAHNGTPYLAIDLTDGKIELLIMKENLINFADSRRFFRFPELLI